MEKSLDKNANIPSENYVDSIGSSDDENNSNGFKLWLKRSVKNRAQITSASAGLKLLMISGLHIFWGVYLIPTESITYSTSTFQLFFVLAMFYAFANIGSAIGVLFNSRVEKKTIYYICAAFNVIGGILFIVGGKKMQLILVGRMFGGLAFGMTYLITIIHASENCVKEIRGSLLTIVNFAMVTQYAAIMGLNLMNDSETNSDIITLNFLVGIMIFIYVVLAILFTFLSYESSVFLILKGNDDLAIKNMMKLRNDSVETSAIRKDYQEIKTMIEESEHEIQSYWKTNGTGFTIVLLTKILSSISTMMPINMVMLFVSALAFQSVSIGGLICMLPRLITPMIPMNTCDYIGRRKLFMFSGFSSGICLFTIGVLLAVFQIDDESPLPIALIIFVLLYQSFIGCGINSIPDILMSEAFSIANKAYFINFIILIENCIQIIGIAIFVYVTITTKYYAIISILISIIMIALTIIITLLLPETKQKSLRETTNLFKKFVFMGRRNI